MGDESISKTEVCERLDELAVEFFSTLTSFYSEQTLLQQAMKSGFLNMSRARYSMGIKTVDIHKVDENNMKASFKVTVSSDGDKDSFRLEEDEDLETKMNDLDISNDDKTNSESGVRRRKGNPEPGTENSNSDNKDVSDSGDSSAPMKKLQSDKDQVVDPIKWFGILVPAALRQSQKDFKQTVNVAISVANLKSKLQNLQQEYVTLLKKKQQC